MTQAITTLNHLTDMRATSFTNRTAYRFLGDGESETASLTFGELQTRANQTAGGLTGRVAPGARVLLFLSSGPEFIIAFHACLRAGVIAVPAFTPGLNQAAERIAVIAKDCTPSMIITDERRRLRLTREGSNQSIPAGIAVVTPEELQDTQGGALETPAALDDIAFLQYTSGSTGNPRGVCVSHGNLMANSSMIRTAFELSEESVIVSWLPLFHDMGLIGPVLQPIYSGSTAVIMPPAAFIQKPVRWLRAIQNYRGTTAGGPDFAYRLCVESISEKEKRGLDLKTWRTAFNGAEPVRADTCGDFAQAFADCGFEQDAFLPCYGMAEATLLISGDSRGYETSTLEDGKTYVSCGNYQWNDQELYIIDPERAPDDPEALRGDSQLGEILVRGSHVSRGYWGRAPGSNWLRTGDLGFTRDGRLFIAGRIKDVIIIRGRNYYPDDLEKIAETAHSALRAPGFTAAFGVEGNAGESLALAVELRRDVQDFDSEAAGDAISAAIARAFEITPQRIYFLRVNGIPRTSSGKIRRSRTAELIRNGEAQILGEWSLHSVQATGAGTATNGNPNEQKIQAFITRWLAGRLKIPLENVLPERPMTAYGLDSIIAVEAVNAIEEQWGIQLEPWALYEAGTVAALATLLTKRLNADESSPPAEAPATRKSGDASGTIALPVFAEPAPDAKPIRPDSASETESAKGALQPERDVALCDFVPYEGTRVIDQARLLDYTAWMLAAVECVREGVEDRRRADEILASMREKAHTYGVSPEYISKRQINVASRTFVEKPMQTNMHELPYLHRNLLNDVRGEPLETRMKFYEKVVLRILELWYPHGHTAPDDFVHVTCSGYLSPSPPQKLIARRKWTNTGIVNSYQMDCYGAFPAVRIGAGLLAAGNWPGRKECVDVVHTEFASLHCDFGSSLPGNIINLTLFGDGFIKYSLRPVGSVRERGGKGLRIIAAHEELIPDTQDDMTWGPGSYQFNMFLSKNVPLRIREAILPFVVALCKKAGIDFEKEKGSLEFVIHPGGPRILNHIRDTLGISEEQVTRSRNVLHRHGNMSSATVPHIWKDVLEDSTVRAPVVSMAFGPGLTATGLVLEVVS